MSRPTRRFAVFAIAFAGIRDLVPLYAVYALLFGAEGLSDAAISSLFLIWSVTAFAAEVPSGALADLRSRRLLLSLSSLLTAVAFGVWMVVPTYAGFAAGFVLWGVGGALASGTWESLVFDTLAALGATDRYAGIIGGGESAGWLAAVASAAVATPLFAVGGYALVGWTSVTVCLLHAGMALALPDPPRTGIDPEDGEEGEQDGADRPGVDPHDADGVGAVLGDYLKTLASGLGEATAHPPVRRAVIGLSLLTGLLAFDEYLPLLAAGTGVAVQTVPLLMTLTFLAQAIAAALAGRLARLDPRWSPRVLAAGALLIGSGAVSGHPLGFAAAAGGYALVTCVLIVTDARLQHAITGPARATITSTVGFGSELVAVALFASYALGSATLTIGALVAVNALPLLALAGWMRSAQGR